MDDNPITKVLGVQWNRDTDKLFIGMKPESLPTITKRLAVSVVAQIYDPIGILAPVIMPARLLIQELWLAHRDLTGSDAQQAWDWAVPEEMAERFRLWYAGLEACERLCVDRRIGKDDSKSQAIYIFCDASIKAYGAVAYLRAVTESAVTFNFMASKARVAPLLKERKKHAVETMTIPRLELLAAVVGAEFVQQIREAWDLTAEFPFFYFYRCGNCTCTDLRIHHCAGCFQRKSTENHSPAYRKKHVVSCFHT